MPLRVTRIAKTALVVCLAFAPIALASVPAYADAVRQREWWLTALHMPQAWRSGTGAGITVAVLADGVAANQADLSGSVISGPDFTRSGRRASSSHFGITGTLLAGLISGHGHGKHGASGIYGISPGVKVLSVRVVLSPGDPLWSNAKITSGLRNAIASGIRYAVDHGATVIDLPADPGVPGFAGPQGVASAAGGSAAERSAIAYAVKKDVVLVAPAGDNAQAGDAVNYPAAYPGVIAVGAVGQNSATAGFSSHQSYVTLSAPGQGIEGAAPVGYQKVNGTWPASAIVAGVAALIKSQFPNLAATQVREAMIGSTSAGHLGTISPAAALQAAATMSPPHAQHAMVGALPRVDPAAPFIPGQGSIVARELQRDGEISGALLILLLVPITWYGLVSRRRKRQEALSAQVERLDQQPATATMLADPMLEFFAPQQAPGDWQTGARSAPVVRLEPAAGFIDRPAVAAPAYGAHPAPAYGAQVLAAPTAPGALPIRQVPSGPRPAAARSGDPDFPGSGRRAAGDAGPPGSGFDPFAGAGPTRDSEGVAAQPGFGPLGGQEARQTIRRPPVSGAPPWDPAPEPTSELPWAFSSAPPSAPGVTRPVTFGTQRARVSPEAVWDEAPPPGQTSPRSLFDPPPHTVSAPAGYHPPPARRRGMRPIYVWHPTNVTNSDASGHDDLNWLDT